MKHIAVKSTTIYSVGFDPAACQLQATYKDARGKPTNTYQYSHVLSEDLTAVLFAENFDSAFSQKFAGNGSFPCTKLEEVVVPDPDCRVVVSL